MLFRSEGPDRHLKKKSSRPFDQRWHGVTVFYQDRGKSDETYDVYYVDTTEGYLPLSLTYAETEDIREVFNTWNTLPGKLGREPYDENPRETYVAVVRQHILQLKSNKKELDERYFDSKEKKQFDESDAKEWLQWLKKEAIDPRPIPYEKASQIPKEKIISTPMRYVRTNKGPTDEQFFQNPECVYQDMWTHVLGCIEQRHRHYPVWECLYLLWQR